MSTSPASAEIAALLLESPRLYAPAGIPEYWIVNLEARAVEVPPLAFPVAALFG